MSNFVKLTTQIDEGYLRTWVQADSIVELSQNSATQAGDNAGTCVFVDETTIDLCQFNETIESLN